MLRVFSGPSIQSVGIAVSRFNVLMGVMGLGHCNFLFIMRCFNFMKVQLIAMLAIFVASCSSSDENESVTPSPETKMVQVSFGFGGEVTSIEESPLSRVGNAKDWYAFQVYEANDNGYYEKYAYGFFDNKSDMVINLKEGHKYRFDVSMVVDGSEKVYKFSLNNAGWAGIGNSFFISNTEFVRYMYEGYLYLKKPNDTFDRPNVDRFFGRTDDYIAKEGGSVTINMKRVSFGAKFVAEDFAEGNLEINVEGAPTINLDSSNGNEVEDIISFNNLLNAYTSAGEYYESIPVNIVWVKPNGVRVPIASQKIDFKRNKLTTVNFVVNENVTSNSFTLNSDEKMENGDVVKVENDGTITVVNPTN